MPSTSCSQHLLDYKGNVAMQRKPSIFSVLFRFMILSTLKIIFQIFYTAKVQYLNSFSNWKNVKLIILLNHTSLFEIVFIRMAPYNYLWELSKHLVFPAADITYDRKIFGTFLKCIGVSVKSLTRKRDSSWFDFLSEIRKDSVLVFVPEGRMKRKTGLDKEGKPMTVRGGIADVLPHFKDKEMLFIYSGGLHHVLAPGDKMLKIFKRIHFSLEKLSVSDYMKRFTENDKLNKEALVKDLERRRDNFCPKKSKQQKKNHTH